MTNEQIIELANQAGITFITKSGVASATEEWLVGFAKLVRNEVLEDAALACESLDEASGPCSWHYEIATQDCANAIRSMK